MTSADAWRERFRGFAERPPHGWRAIRTVLVGLDALPIFTHGNGTAVALSVDVAPSGFFVHLSMSRSDRLPRWPELRAARDVFLGPNVAAVHLVPPATDHRDLHPFCLHLWARADGEPILDPLLGEYVAPMVKP